MNAIELLFWAALLSALYTYFGYPLLLVSCRWLITRPSSRLDDGYCPTVSIILAAYNEALYITQKLNNCLSLDYPPDKLQILVGSDGSEDRTNELAAEFRDRGVELFEFSPRRGKMATVNRLVQRASGDICVFSDISELFDRDAVRRLVRHFADRSIGGVTGNHIYHHDDSGLGIGTRFYWKFQRMLQAVESRLYSVCACDGTIYACRRGLYCAPPDNTINDDVAVPLGILNQGRRVIFEPQAVARGNVLRETQRFFRQKIRSQAGKYQIFAGFPQMFRPWPIWRFIIFISHSVMPVMVPWLLLVILLANASLALAGSLFYTTLMAIQAGFYLLAAAGYIAQQRQLHVPVAAIPFYFVTANVGSLCGFLAYVTGGQAAAWKKVE